MKEILQTYLQSVKKVCPKITNEELDYFGQGLNIIQLPAIHFYIQANSIQNEIGYVSSGLLRAFYVDDKGNEVTVSFIKEGEFATHYNAFNTKKPSKYYFQCIETSVLINLSYMHIYDCCEKMPVFERYLRLIIEDAFNLKQNRIDSLIFDNAETRYIDFIKDNPDLFNRVSISHLSSYLGIERQSLTRIRKNLLKKGI